MLAAVLSLIRLNSSIVPSQNPFDCMDDVVDRRIGSYLPISKNKFSISCFELINNGLKMKLRITINSTFIHVKCCGLQWTWGPPLKGFPKKVSLKVQLILNGETKMANWSKLASTKAWTVSVRRSYGRTTVFLQMVIPWKVPLLKISPVLRESFTAS